MRWCWPKSWRGGDCEVERQAPLAIVYEGLRLEEGFRADIIVEGKVIERGCGGEA